MMDLNNECKGGDGFIDRSKVRILLCDSDAKSLKEVFTLLSECSYQVTSVKSARQVIDALNAEGPDIDIILAEIDLPMAKGMKMLRYITRDKDLRRIPVIMMSREDEVAVVVKCLKLGAADYLVKPLRTNELLNLWTHMWRRRRMLGLAEKNMLSYDFDLVGSDPSDPNTNSTNLFSDDTDERSHRCTHLQRGSLNHQENERSVATAGDGGFGTDGTATSTPTVPAAIDPPLNHLTGSNLEPIKRYSNSVQFSSTPKQSKLKIGESSAFFTYVKSTVLRGSCQEPPQANENGSLHRGMVEKLQVVNEGINNTKQANGVRETQRNYSQRDNLQNGNKYGDSLERSCIPPTELHGRTYQENMNSSRIVTSQSKDSSQADGSGFSTQNPYPYYMQGVMNQVMMQSSAHVHASLAMMPQYGHHLPHCPPNHPNGYSGFPYYHHHHPMNTSLQHNQMSSQHIQNGQHGQMSIQNGQMSIQNGQMSTPNGQMSLQNGQMAIQNGQMATQNGQMATQNGQMAIQNGQMSIQNGQMSMVHHSWSPAGNLSSNEVKMTKLDRREEALLKFRRKRNQRCFDKKIRYVNRKRLAERRPRVRGQFVRKMNGVNVDLNGQPDSADYDDEEEEEEEEEERDSSPQDDALGT